MKTKARTSRGSLTNWPWHTIPHHWNGVPQPIEPGCGADRLNPSTTLPALIPKDFTPMDATLFDQLEQTVNTAGPIAALDRLAEELKTRKDYAGLFYALLMKKRYELGVSPIATGSNQDLPEDV